MKDYTKYRYSYSNTCAKCGKQHHRNQDLVMELNNFKVYCLDTCSQGLKNPSVLDNKEIYLKMPQVHKAELAYELRENTMAKTYGLRPTMDQVYYMLQVAQEERMATYNEVIKYIIDRMMELDPRGIILRSNPIPSRQHARGANALVGNPFARDDSEETIVESKPLTNIAPPKPEPEPEPQPEPEPEPVKEEPEEEIFTL